MPGIDDDEFREANEVIHPVENQWHYPILTKYGYVPKTLSAKGFVRSYSYEHPNGHVMTVNTGVHADYWTSENDSVQGYWYELAAFLKHRNIGGTNGNHN